MNRRFHGCGFAKVHLQIRCKDVEKGIRGEAMNPRNILTDFAIVWWDERSRVDQGVPRDSDIAVLLY